MNCNIIKDLIPLYIDGCCSEESKAIVNDHIQTCDGCRRLFEDMTAPADMVTVPKAPKTFRKLNDWKASILQSVLLFVSFGLITIGVALEAASPSGLLNGFWAFNLVIPATGLLLSLVNWYFIRLYKSKRQFSICSTLFTLSFTLICYVWAGMHYEVSELRYFIAPINHNGILLTTLFCLLSKTLSGLYANLIGKE